MWKLKYKEVITVIEGLRTVTETINSCIKKIVSTIECRDVREALPVWNSKNQQKSIKLQVIEKHTQNT